MKFIIKEWKWYVKKSQEKINQNSARDYNFFTNQSYFFAEIFAYFLIKKKLNHNAIEKA